MKQSQDITCFEIVGAPSSHMSAITLNDIFKAFIWEPAGNMADRMATRLMGPKCPSCGRRTLEVEKSSWARGWNNLCGQAAGDVGRWRHGCEKVQFAEPDEIYYARMRRTAPWVTPRRDPDWQRSVLGEMSHLSSEL